ncbi:MAG: DUF559 domain-containing protein [Planctomycetota bacterium]|jgi:very-short-patch-repair endonuclease|nr:DUF559 domain-containing protein [Planctomycetota bacterium]
MPRDLKNYKELPYNPALKDRARALRRAGNLAEALFWNQVKKKQFNGLDFDRQKVIGNYIVDFYCPAVNVVIEIDGVSHDHKGDYDVRRDEYLQNLGLTVIRVADAEVKRDMFNVMESLREHPAFAGLGQA